MVGRRHYPWWVSCQLGAFLRSLIVFFKWGVYEGIVFSGFSLILTILMWRHTLVLERMGGNHRRQIAEAFKFSWMLFIFSEAIFFFGIFWAFFDRALSPSVELGIEWPPIGVIPINPYGIPLFNTVVLLSRGVSLTWSHSSLLSKGNAVPGLTITVVFAFIFEAAQYVEYSQATFSIRDGIFGRVFYFGTGFHGLHVIFGHVFLCVNLYRVYWCHFTRTRHLRFEFRIIYWHFVDVVWIFLYIRVYWWIY